MRWGRIDLHNERLGLSSGAAMQSQLLSCTRQSLALRAPVQIRRNATRAMVEHRPRNRFKIILPFDETRVIPKDYSATDYINANRIRSSLDSREEQHITLPEPVTTTVNIA